MTLSELLSGTKAALKNAGIENADFESFLLFEKATGINRSTLVCHGSCKAEASAQAQLLEFVTRRLSGEPLQYILGEWDFCDLTFKVGEGVLIPRPETEILVEKADLFLKTHKGAIVYDLCAGSGAVGLTVAKHNPDCRVYLFEKYSGALQYLECNAREMALANAEVLHCDILAGCPEALPYPNVILSNPPYICTDEIRSLQKEVQKEPDTALDGGADGLLFYRCIQKKWLPLLKSGDIAVLECGDGQTQAVMSIFKAFSQMQIPLYDFNHIDRAVQIIV